MIAAKCNTQSQEATSSRKWLDEAQRTGEKDNYSGKRRQPRCSWDAQVTIDVLQDDETTESFYANTLNISAGGIGMRCRKPVPTHALVRITVDESGESVLARVAQCTQGICDYHIGVEFVRESRTSATSATPTVSRVPAAAGFRPTAHAA